MSIRVCKFGGSSLADAAQIDKVRRIVLSDPERRYVVVSAPGRRHKDDQKVTDLLYLCHEHARQGLPFDAVWERVAERFGGIARELGIGPDLAPVLAEVKRTLERDAADGLPADYAASRGEYLNAALVAEALGWPMVDAAELIYFDARGRLDEVRTFAAVPERLRGVERAVIPGFYGTDVAGRVKTFSRGGSDVSGAIVARGVAASVYENWTDVSGLLMADPRVVENPRTIETITYRELRELSYMGASVLHDEAVFPVRDAGIPVHIRNTNRPDDPGTIIAPTLGEPPAIHGTITGIAGRRDFTVIAVEKAMMNAELGFGRRVLSALEAHGISFEHMPSGIDTLSVVIADAELDGKLEGVVEEIRRACGPDAIEVFPEMALVATVGRGMAKTPGMAAKLFGALAQAGVNIRMIDQGSSELNIIVGVEVGQFEPAMRAIYAAFVR